MRLQAPGLGWGGRRHAPGPLPVSCRSTQSLFLPRIPRETGSGAGWPGCLTFDKEEKGSLPWSAEQRGQGPGLGACLPCLASTGVLVFPQVPRVCLGDETPAWRLRTPRHGRAVVEEKPWELPSLGAFPVCTPSPAPPALLVLQPMCQTDRQTWVAGGGRNLAPGQLCPYQLGSLGVCGQQNGPPTFPLLIRQPLLMSGCHCCSIMPPEPSAPPHLWGDPGGCLAGGAEAREEGSVSGSCWGCLLGPEAGRSVGFPPNRSSSGSFFS